MGKPTGRRHRQEESLKQYVLCLSLMYVVVGGLGGVVAGGAVFPKAEPPLQIRLTMFFVGSFFGALGSTALVVNYCARRFAAWTRIPLIVLATLALPAFPFGTAFGGAILNLLLKGPHPRLLTPEYELIVRTEPAAPHERTNCVTWFVVIMIVLIAVIVYLVSLIPQEIRHNL